MSPWRRSIVTYHGTNNIEAIANVRGKRGNSRTFQNECRLTSWLGIVKENLESEMSTSKPTGGNVADCYLGPTCKGRPWKPGIEWTWRTKQKAQNRRPVTLHQTGDQGDRTSGIRFSPFSGFLTNSEDRVWAPNMGLNPMKSVAHDDPTFEL